ncbi:MAG: ATP-binding protein, partial [Candidatus Saccharimonas sp.]|nr:ATP-binding protein [Planctomycetaceae bacterium]
MPDPILRQVFLSTVTTEFGEHRALLKADLSLPRVKVQEQGDLVQGEGKLLQTLDDYVREHCDAVIHVVGSAAGQPLKPDEVRWLLETYPDFATRFPFLADELRASPTTLTYTQMEAWLALYHRKRCHLFRPSLLEQTPLPADHPQQRHWQRLNDLGKHWGTFDDPQHLCRRVLRDLHGLWPNDIPAPRVKLLYGPLGQLFIGRDGFLDDLRTRFEQARRDGHWPRHAVHGLGGVGKTRLVVEYAWRYRDHYAAVVMVNAGSPESLDRELTSLAGVLDSHVDPHLPDPVKRQATLDWLHRNPGWLLLVDNVDTDEAREAVAGYFPAWAAGHVVITGRVSSWPRDVEPLDLKVLAVEDAERFLLAATAGHRLVQRDDPEQARRLAEDDLDCLCLALEQAAAYIGEQEISLAEYRDRWAKNKKNVRAWADKLLMHYHEESPVSISVATTWQTTFDQLTPAARTLLELFSWLAPDPLPRGLLEHAELQTQLQSASGQPKADVEQARAELRRYSLLSRTDQKQTGSAGQVHRLVQLITRDRLTDEQRQTMLTAILTAVNWYTPTESDDVRTWPILEPLRPHLMVLIAHADAASIAEPTARLLSVTGGMLQGKALFAEAEPLMRRALAIDEQFYGGDHPNVASHLILLVALLQAKNRLAEAELLLRRA